MQVLCSKPLLSRKYHYKSNILKNNVFTLAQIRPRILFVQCIHRILVAIIIILLPDIILGSHSDNAYIIYTWMTLDVFIWDQISELQVMLTYVLNSEMYVFR